MLWLHISVIITLLTRGSGRCQVGAAIKGSAANLEAFHDAGGFERLTQLLQWAALAFPAAAAGGASARALSMAALEPATLRPRDGTGSPARQTRGAGSGEGVASHAAPLPLPRELLELFAVLASWLCLAHGGWPAGNEHDGGGAAEAEGGSWGRCGHFTCYVHQPRVVGCVVGVGNAGTPNFGTPQTLAACRWE
jgi:hypothetical protein